MRTRLLMVPAILLFAFAVRADDQTTKLSVEVKTLGGKPIERAGVIVRFVEGRSVAKLGKKIRTTYELRTNQEGIARIPSIPKGKILIQVIAKGYQTFGDTFSIEEDEKTVEIKLKPPQAPYSSHQ
jgi:hypothetical protein